MGDKNKKSVLLIDEVDVFFSSTFFGKTFNPVALFEHPCITKIIKEIWDEAKPRNGKCNYANSWNLLEKIKDTEDYKILIQKY